MAVDGGCIVRALSCQEFVELVTAFLDGALDPESERRFVEHVANCVGCEPYLDQFRQTICALVDTAEETVPEQIRDAVMDAFRGLPR